MCGAQFSSFKKFIVLLRNQGIHTYKSNKVSQAPNEGGHVARFNEGSAEGRLYQAGVI